MKKFISLLIVIMMVLSFAACSSGNSEEAVTEEAQTSYEVTGTVSEIKDGKITINTKSNETLTFEIENAEVHSDKTIQPGDIATISYTGEIENQDTSACVVTLVNILPGEEQTFVGSIVKIGNGTLTVKDDSNNELTFNIANAERHYANGIKKGNKVSIVYTGTITGSDTSKCYVHSVTDNDPNKEKEEKVTIKSVTQTVWATTTVNIRTGSSVSSKKVGTLSKNEKIIRTGICSNGWSRVSYKGKDRYVYSDYLTAKQPQATKPQPKPEEDQYQIIEGTIVEATSNVITIEVVGGDQLSFLTEDVTNIHLSDGVLLGEVIVIEYSGDIYGTDASQAVVEAIYDKK